MSEEQESTDFQIQKLVWEIEKLKAETQNLNNSNRWENRIARYTPFLPLFIAIIGFYVGIYNFQQDSINQANNLRQELENKFALAGKENRNKFYEKQLEIYLDLTKTVAQISIEKDNNNIEKLHEHFLELYRGNLVIVRDRKVREAAKTFEETYQTHNKALSESAEELANACRSSLGNKWSIPLIENNEY